MARVRYCPKDHEIRIVTGRIKSKSRCITCDRMNLRKWRGMTEIPTVEGISCELCSTSGKMNADHDHQTNKFRGWLCKSCNLVVGIIESRGVPVKRIVKYLERRVG